MLTTTRTSLFCVLFGIALMAVPAFASPQIKPQCHRLRYRQNFSPVSPFSFPDSGINSTFVSSEIMKLTGDTNAYYDFLNCVDEKLGLV
jgi:hypothetical protein